MSTKQIEQAKFDNIDKNFELNILHMRFVDIDALNDYLVRHWSMSKVEVQNTDYTDIVDHNVLSSINKDWGYVDIYYLIDRQDNLYITEVGISSD